MSKPYNISTITRFVDESGYTWQVRENLFFGKWLCRREDRAMIGQWTSKEIRTLIEENGVQEDSECLEYGRM